MIQYLFNIAFFSCSTNLMAKFTDREVSKPKAALGVFNYSQLSISQSSSQTTGYLSKFSVPLDNRSRNVYIKKKEIYLYSLI